MNYFKTNEKFSNILLISLFLIIILIGIILLALGTTNEYETNSPSIEEICLNTGGKFLIVPDGEYAGTGFNDIVGDTCQNFFKNTPSRGLGITFCKNKAEEFPLECGDCDAWNFNTATNTCSLLKSLGPDKEKLNVCGNYSTQIHPTPTPHTPTPHTPTPHTPTPHTPTPHTPTPHTPTPHTPAPCPYCVTYEIGAKQATGGLATYVKISTNSIDFYMEDADHLGDSEIKNCIEQTIPENPQVPPGGIGAGSECDYDNTIYFITKIDESHVHYYNYNTNTGVGILESKPRDFYMYDTLEPTDCFIIMYIKKPTPEPPRLIGKGKMYSAGINLFIQTFKNIDWDQIYSNEYVCGLIICALHARPIKDEDIGKEYSGGSIDNSMIDTPMIFLNDDPLSSPIFEDLWVHVKNFVDHGGTAQFLIGGAGGGFWSIAAPEYRDLLLNACYDKKYISGICLNPEQYPNDLELSQSNKGPDPTGLMETIIFHIIESNNKRNERLNLTISPGESSLRLYGPSFFNGINHIKLFNNINDTIDSSHLLDYDNVYDIIVTIYPRLFDREFSEKGLSEIVDVGWSPNVLIPIEEIHQSNFNYNQFTDKIVNIKSTYPNIEGISVWELGYDWVDQELLIDSMIEGFYS